MLDDLHIEHEIHWFWAKNHRTNELIVAKQVRIEPRSKFPRATYYTAGKNTCYSVAQFAEEYRIITEILPPQ